MRPNFLIIGAARSGTTALSYFLTQHPDVYFAEPKEPHFLAFANKTIDFRGPGDDSMINQRAICTAEGYESLFGNTKGRKAIGEGSVSTLYYPDDAIPNIQRYTPDAKMIVLLRNPTDRAFSSYLYMTARGFEPTKDFESALDEEENRIANNWHHIWHYAKQGYYSHQIKKFIDAFGRDRLSIHLFEDLHAPEMQTIPKIFRFLEIDDSFQPKTEKEINRSGKPKSNIVQWLFRKGANNRYASKFVKAILPRGARDSIRAMNLSHPKMQPETRERLNRLFKDEVERLKVLLDNPLDAWTRNQDVVEDVVV